MTTPDIVTAVRAWAKGIYPLEAGVELLIRSPKRAIYDGAPWLNRSDDDRLAAIDVDTLLDHTGPWSGGERRYVRIAASLLSSEHPADLHNDLAGLDRTSLLLVLAAIAHAAGSHEQSDLAVEWDDAGRPTAGRMVRLGPAFTWPNDQVPAELGRADQ